MLIIQVNYINYIVTCHFYLKKIKIDKTKKLMCKLRDKKKYVVHISILKQALNHWLKLKKVHRVIEFNQEAWLKKYIDINTELREKASSDFETNEQRSIW